MWFMVSNSGWKSPNFQDRKVIIFELGVVFWRVQCYLASKDIKSIPQMNLNIVKRPEDAIFLIWSHYIKLPIYQVWELLQYIAWDFPLTRSLYIDFIQWASATRERGLSTREGRLLVVIRDWLIKTNEHRKVLQNLNHSCHLDSCTVC
jgi:hypothetical protein